MVLSQWTNEADEDWDTLFENADRGSLPLAFREMLNEIESNPERAWDEALPVDQDERLPLECRVTPVEALGGIQWAFELDVPIIVGLLLGGVPIAVVHGV